MILNEGTRRMIANTTTLGEIGNNTECAAEVNRMVRKARVVNRKSAEIVYLNDYRAPLTTARMKLWENTP